jgi:hypothetical protein
VDVAVNAAEAELAPLPPLLGASAGFCDVDTGAWLFVVVVVVGMTVLIG